MTTNTFSGPVVHTSDADFRVWGLALSDALTTAGFPKSGDTGQINWATVTRPGTNTAGGYEIRYLNDSLHGTKPCYVKIEFGTGSNALHPTIWVTAGTGTNGAGTISGVMWTRQSVAQAQVPNAGNWPTYICVKSGYVSVAFARGGMATSAGVAFFSVARMCDAAGDPTNVGFHFTYSAGGSSTASLARKSYVTAEIDDTNAVCLFPGGNTTTLVGADVQLMRHFGYQPTIRCVPFYLGFLNAEIGNEATFTATPVGVTSRTYLALGNAAGVPINCSPQGQGTHKLAMQYD